jgi:histidinol-phosphate aminotransferase
MSTQAISKIRIRSDIAEMEGYGYPSGTLELLSERMDRPASEIIKLDTNENPYGPSPKALAALAKMESTAHIYPDVRVPYLRAGLAEYTGIDPEHILVGQGCDEIIKVTEQLFLEPGDIILNCPPTFTMYSLVAGWLGAKTVNIPRRADFSLDVEGIEKAAYEAGDKAKLLFLCSPNNPDGSRMEAGVLDRLLQLPLVVVLDEAYFEFARIEASEDNALRIPHTPNLIIFRTFSKWAGLAGLRIGYGLYPLEIIEHLWKIKLPFNVSAAADTAARATLNDMTLMQANIQKIIAERERLLVELNAIPYLHAYPSYANFIFCKVTGVPIPEFQTRLENEGILIRYYEGKVPGHIRISIGRPDQNDKVMDVMRQIGADYA